MPFDWDSVTGKITRSLMSSSGLKISSTSSPSGPMCDCAIWGLEARRAVGSTVTLPSAAMDAGAKGQRGNMSLADGAKTENEADGRLPARRTGRDGRRCSD